MKLPTGISQWGVAALSVICLLLVVNLVSQYRAMQPASSRPHSTVGKGPPTQGVKGSSPANADLARYDPDIHFATLKKFDSRPLPEEDRDPFQFVGSAAPPPPTQAAPASGPKPAPAPPPPPPLKAMGYNELPGGKKEAMVTFNDDLVVVHEGDLIGTKFKVVKIDPSMVVVQDGDTHQNIELPFPPQ